MLRQTLRTKTTGRRIASKLERKKSERLFGQAGDFACPSHSHFFRGEMLITETWRKKVRD